MAHAVGWPTSWLNLVNGAFYQRIFLTGYGWGPYSLSVATANQPKRGAQGLTIPGSLSAPNPRDRPS